MPTLGESLAHGIAKRESREGADAEFEKLQRLIGIATESGKRTKGAIYRRVKAALLQTFKGKILEVNEERKDKKNAAFTMLFWSYDDDYSVTVQYLCMRRDDVSHPLILMVLKITKHALARIYQSFGVTSFKEFISKEPHIFTEIVNFAKNRTSGLTHKIITEDVVFHAETTEDQAIEIKTAITLNAMSPPKARKMRALIPAGKELVILTDTD